MSDSVALLGGMLHEYRLRPLMYVGRCGLADRSGLWLTWEAC